MIWRPKVNQRVRLHYAKKKRGMIRLSEVAMASGRVVAVARGPGPINVAVQLADGETLVVVPRGNLQEDFDYNRLRGPEQTVMFGEDKDAR